MDDGQWKMRNGKQTMCKWDNEAMNNRCWTVNNDLTMTMTMAVTYEHMIHDIWSAMTKTMTLIMTMTLTRAITKLKLKYKLNKNTKSELNRPLVYYIFWSSSPLMSQTIYCCDTTPLDLDSSILGHTWGRSERESRSRCRIFQHSLSTKLVLL